LNTGNGLATRVYLDELWTMALSTIVNALRTHSVNYYTYTVIFYTFIINIYKRIYIFLGILHRCYTYTKNKKSYHVI